MKPRPLFPFAVSLQAAALFFEGDGRPALYLCAQTRGCLPKLHRVPEGCAVTVHAPRPLPPALPSRAKRARHEAQRETAPQTAPTSTDQQAQT